MSSTTINQVVTSAENAASDSLNRYLDEMCEVAEEKENYELIMLEKTFNVFVNYTLYDFEPFNRKNRPQGAGCIMELIKKKKFKQNQWRIVVRPNATSEMIQAALNMIVLPF